MKYVVKNGLFKKRLKDSNLIVVKLFTDGYSICDVVGTVLAEIHLVNGKVVAKDGEFDLVMEERPAMTRPARVMALKGCWKGKELLIEHTGKGFAFTGIDISVGSLSAKEVCLNVPDDFGAFEAMELYAILTFVQHMDDIDLV